MGKKENKWVYNSSRWQRVRALKLRQNPLCEYCFSSFPRLATEVDHFVAISDGGEPFDLENLKSSCKSCHSQKTAQGERLHGSDVEGTPLDPNHHWNKR